MIQSDYFMDFFMYAKKYVNAIFFYPKAIFL